MSFTFKGFLLLALMVLSAASATVLRPTISLADELPPINLESMVPASFGDWQQQAAGTLQIIDPQQKEMLDEIYSETLTRTYVNKDGYRIMLSIAYGKNQSDALQLHKPEVCYPAQGFQVSSKTVGTLDLLGKHIPATRLLTSMGQRNEPLTYWTVVGSEITTSEMSKKKVELRYAMNNRIPDGMLVRISSIDTNSEKAFALQRQFSNDMVASIAPEFRPRFAGSPSTP